MEEITAKIKYIDNFVKHIVIGIQNTSTTSEETTASVEKVDTLKFINENVDPKFEEFGNSYFCHSLQSYHLHYV